MRHPPRTVSLLAALSVALLFASAPAAAQFREVPAEEVEKLITDLQGSDPETREIAKVRVRNLEGSALEQVEAAVARDGLDPAAHGPLREALPLLRARATRVKRVKADADAMRRLTLGAYDRVGKHDPRWDAAAKEGIRIAMLPDALRGPGEDDAATAAALQKAVDAGCDDPLVQFFWRQAQLELPGAARHELLYQYYDATTALWGTQYPAHRRMMAAARFILDSKAGDPQAAAIVSSLLPVALAEKDLPGRQAETYADAAYEALVVARKNRQDAFEEVYAAYSKGRPADDPGPYLFKGNRYIKYAWEARGSGFAGTVTGEGWRLFRDRLTEAERALTKAWEMDPTDGRVPASMITVHLGLHGEREPMEAWFDKAMQADPDNYEACENKLHFLLPRWHGSHEEMVEFGRQCLQEQSWLRNLPYVLIKAHLDISKEVSDPEAYLGQPHVWRDVKAGHEGFLRVYPDFPRAKWHKSHLAWSACQAGRWAEAKRCFEAVGDDPHPGVFRSKAYYEYWRRKAQKNAELAPPEPEPLEQVRR